MSEKMERLLVYGLLRRGMLMEDLMSQAKCLGVREVSGFKMFDLGEYPGAVVGDGRLVAELYEISTPATFAELDVAEGVHSDPPYYRRIEVMLDDGPAWIYEYLRSVDGCPLIETGDWTDRTHGTR